MAYRIIVAGIILFWVAMMGRLILAEAVLREVGSSPVPVAFVLRLMFHHKQTSDLAMYNQAQHRADGAIHLDPKRLSMSVDGKSEPLNLLSGSGSFAVNLPGVSVQRVVMRGSAEIDDRGGLNKFELTASLHEGRQGAPGMIVFVEGDPARDDWHYSLRQSSIVLREDRGSLASLLATVDPHLPGLDFAAMQRMHQQQMSSTHVTAHLGALRLGGEAIETYVISVSQGDAAQATIHFNQLGQVLAIKTFTGYDFYEEGVAP